MSRAKQLVSILATFLSTIVASIEAPTSLRCVSCINYPVLFQKNPVSSVLALINSGSKVNAMHPAYAKKLGLVIQKTDVKAQKIDNITLETFGMIIAAFTVYNRAKKVCFFEKTFLLADINMNVALKMLFLILSNADIYFIY